MSVSNLLSNRISRTHFDFPNPDPKSLKTPNFFSSKIPLNFKFLTITSPNTPNSFKPHLNRLWRFQASDFQGTVQSENVNRFNFDAFLSIGELLCLTCSAVISVGCALNFAVPSSSSRTGVIGLIANRVVVWQVVLVATVGIGILIRRRQWMRICRHSEESGGGGGGNFVGRIEKLEEDLRSLATLIRVMSRQLEKLGIRFRVTRKALKDPIAETAALAQKNSEATRALAAQGDILEKELREIQKVLLAMQEQQQKQLELILAIAKSSKLWDNKRAPNQDQNAPQLFDDSPKPVNTHQAQAQAQPRPKGTVNDRA